MDEGKINGRLNSCYTNGVRLLHPSGALKHVVFIALRVSSVLSLMRRMRMFVLRMVVTCEDFRLKMAPDVIFDVLKDFTSDSWDVLLHLSTTPVPQTGKVDLELVGRGQVFMLARFPKWRHQSGYTTPSNLGAYKWATRRNNPHRLLVSPKFGPNRKR